MFSETMSDGSGAVVQLAAEPLAISTPEEDATNPKDNNNARKAIEIWESWDITVRPCHWYKEELKECKSIKGRFHHYFIHGSKQDCQPWKTDYDNCVKYEKTQDENTKKEIMESEFNRFKERMGASLRNDTWTQRKSPPADWNKPLPDFLIQRQKGSMFKEITSEKDIENVSTCVIL